jgi:hypothetical protein
MSSQACSPPTDSELEKIRFCGARWRRAVDTQCLAINLHAAPPARRARAAILGQGMRVGEGVGGRWAAHRRLGRRGFGVFGRGRATRHWVRLSGGAHARAAAHPSRLRPRRAGAPARRPRDLELAPRGAAGRVDVEALAGAGAARDVAARGATRRERLGGGEVAGVKGGLRWDRDELARALLVACDLVPLRAWGGGLEGCGAVGERFCRRGGGGGGQERGRIPRAPRF